MNTIGIAYVPKRKNRKGTFFCGTCNHQFSHFIKEPPCPKCGVRSKVTKFPPETA